MKLLDGMPLNRFRVTFIDSGMSVVEFFICHAEDHDHAVEQCENAYPECDILTCQIIEVNA